jgi:hypothetical protein
MQCGNIEKRRKKAEESEKPMAKESNQSGDGVAAKPKAYCRGVACQ